MVLKTVNAIESNSYTSLPQNDSGSIKHAPKIFKETCEIIWSQSSEAVRNFIRGLSPHPAAWTSIHGKLFKIYLADIVTHEHPDDMRPGEYVTDNETFLHFRTNDGFIAVLELQPEGKKRLKVEDYFRGNKL
nr:Formyl transferase, C-terminal domain protein [uncultured bacterium]